MSGSEGEREREVMIMMVPRCKNRQEGGFGGDQVKKLQEERVLTKAI